MITCDEYVKKMPRVGWLNGLELLDWVLQGDAAKSVYKDKSPDMTRLYDLREELGKIVPKNGFSSIVEEVYRREYKVEEYHNESGGDIDVDRYLDKDERCFVDYRKKMIHRPAFSVVMDMSIPWCERESTSMEQRHEKVYRMAIEAEAQGAPCRVVAAGASKITEWKDTPVRLYVVIKDYCDPIFPGLWGAFKSNRTCNDFLNCVYDFLVGTREYNNGRPTTVNVAEDIYDEEVVLVDPRRLEYKESGL